MDFQPHLCFFWEGTKRSHRKTQRRAHVTHSHSTMSPNTAHDDDTHASGDTATATTPASLAGAQEAIPGLLDDIVVTHVLRSEHFDDPADLGRLPAVSRAMRDAVAATGLEFVEIRDEDHAVELGCLSALQRRQRGGRLSRRELLCQAAARSGQLEELKALRADGWPWNKYTCVRAAAMPGTLRCCSGCARTAARGTRGRACWRRWAGISRCCSGRVRTAIRGTNTRAHRRRRVVT